MLSFFIFEVLAILLSVRSFLYPLRYENMINHYSQEKSFSSSVIASIINVESGFKSKAKSNAGACGLMQVLPSTANYICSLYELGSIEKDDLFKPEINIKIGVNYLFYLTQKFDDFDTVLASYNAGETVVRNWLKNEHYSHDGKTLNFIPYKETRNYIKKVKRNMKVYRSYKAFS